MKTVKDIFGLFIGLIGLHYFYSFIILSRLLTINGIDYLPIISMEDITFSFGMVNYTIIGFSLFGFIWIYCWHLFVNDEDKALNNTKDSFSLFHKSAVKFLKEKIFKKYSNERVDIMYYILVLLAFSAIVYFLIVRRMMNRPDWVMGLIFIINFFIIPAYYIYKKSKRKIIILGYIGLTVMWSLFFIKTAYSNIDSSKTNTISEISFEYQEKIICSDKNYNLVFAGYKYLIMRNDSTSIYDLYPMSVVKKITYVKRKIK